MVAELDHHTARLVAARKALAELSCRSVAPELLAEIDQAHAQVEAAERRLATAWLPGLAVRARRRLVAARAAEEELLATAGYASWFGLQLAQVDALLNPPPPEAVAAAEVEHWLALAAWEGLGSVGEPVTDDRTRSGFGSLPELLRSDGPRPAVA